MVNIADVVDLGERLLDPAIPPNPQMSILHIKWQEPRNRIPKPQILPDDREVGFGQQVLIQHSPETRLGLDPANMKHEESKQVNFMYTLNKEEIPTPHSGQFLFDKDARITLSKELIGADCKVVELKVIAVTRDKLPSEVAYKRYEIREGLGPKAIEQEEENIIAPHFEHLFASGNQDYIGGARFDQLNKSGENSVQSSPGDLSESMDFFGTLN